MNDYDLGKKENKKAVKLNNNIQKLFKNYSYNYSG